VRSFQQAQLGSLYPAMRPVTEDGVRLPDDWP
jgi:hypothetical protein